MNEQSVLGIEYIHILNTFNRAPECISINLPPPTQPPPPPTTIGPVTTTIPWNAPQDTTIWEWVVAGICIAIVLIIIILICVNCICTSR